MSTLAPHLQNLKNNIDSWLVHVIDSWDESNLRRIIRFPSSLFNNFKKLDGCDFNGIKDYKIFYFDSEYEGPERTYSQKNKLKGATSSEILKQRTAQFKYILFISEDSNVEDSITSSSDTKYLINFESSIYSYLEFKRQIFSRKFSLDNHYLMKIENFITNQNLNRENLFQHIDQIFYKKVDSKSDVAYFYGLVQDIEKIINDFKKNNTQSFQKTDYYQFFVRKIKDQIQSQNEYKHLEFRYKNLCNGTGSQKTSKIFSSLLTDSINILSNPGAIGEYLQTLFFNHQSSYLSSFSSDNFIDEIIQFEKDRIDSNTILLDKNQLEKNNRYNIFNFDASKKEYKKQKPAFVFKQDDVTASLKNDSHNFFIVNGAKDQTQTNERIINTKNENIKVGVDDAKINDLTFINYDALSSDCPRFIAFKGTLVRGSKNLTFGLSKSDDEQFNIQIKCYPII